MYFFADLEALNCLLQMPYGQQTKPAMDLTVDFTDLPFWFSIARMEPDTLYTAMDIAEGAPSVAAAGISAGRVSAMLTQLVNDGAVIKTEDKRKMYYSLA